MPLPSDVLKAVNVYIVESDEGLTLVDGGWAIEIAREVLERCLRQLGAGFGDIRRFLVTHVHRDHDSMAALLGEEYGANVALGADEKATLDLLNDHKRPRTETPFFASLVAAGAAELAMQWNQAETAIPNQTVWSYPDTWFEGDHEIPVGTRTLDAVHTPGHTAGHYVFADRSAKLLFAGDHVLPTITPSIGFTMPPAPNPLDDFMASLTKVRALPDMRVLPAHGPVAPSTHERVDELLSRHEHRLANILVVVANRSMTASRWRTNWLGRATSDPLTNSTCSTGAWRQWRPRRTSSYSSPEVWPLVRRRLRASSGSRVSGRADPMTAATTIGASATVRSSRDHAPPSI